MCDFLIGLIAMTGVAMEDLKINRMATTGTIDLYAVMGIPNSRVPDIRSALEADPDIRFIEIYKVKDFAMIRFERELHGISGSRRYPE